MWQIAFAVRRAAHSAVIVTFVLSLTVSTRSTTRVCQARATELSSEDYSLRDLGEVSHGAVGRFIPDATTVNSAIQFWVLPVDHTRFNPFSKMKFGR